MTVKNTEKKNIKRKSPAVTVALIMASAVLIVSAYFVIDYFTLGSREQDAYKELNTVYGAAELRGGKSEPAPSLPQSGEVQFKSGFDLADGTYYYDPAYTDQYDLLANKDVKALNSRYKDLVAWLYIPGTEISYPVMRADGDEYLYENYKGEEAKSGSLFMYKDISLDPPDRNATIYGHNMKNGTMFGSLKAYWLVDGMAQNARKIYLDSINGNRVYEIFSVYIADANGNQSDRIYTGSKDFISYLYEIAHKSRVQFTSERDYTDQDKILTLSTCTHLDGVGEEGRLIIQARLVI